MHLVIFCHSLVSDWNHGNAHFLRGMVTELKTRGHEVAVFEPADGWSRACLTRDHGPEAVDGFRTAYPTLASRTYGPGLPDLDRELEGADLVLVHEWNEPALVQAVGRHRDTVGGYVLLFHDTHHRSVSAPSEIAAYDLSRYDGVLAFGEVIRRRYVDAGWADRVWTWHEAADDAVFGPLPTMERCRDLVWISNWGDDERTQELHEFLIEPVKALKLKARVYGVRYPADAQQALAAAGIEPLALAEKEGLALINGTHRVTVHVPRRPYVEALPGIPTIRPFEALACGIPLIAARWDQAGGLFEPGVDYLVARDGEEMAAQMSRLTADPDLRARLAHTGLNTVRARHTCVHRVDQLLAITESLQQNMVLS